MIVNPRTLVINNVNHLKELLINLRLPLKNFLKLESIFRSFGLSTMILHYIEQTGVVASQRMLDLIDERECA